ncbi:MAG TPA: ATP-grasp domain-containing protein [Desulfobacterales bacterium]|nr:ATP-grasp domain-containing protein [Desulfobacterales bacterium]
MPLSPRVLVVGTTPDYIDWIRKSRVDDALFLTDPALRRRAREPAPAPEEEILCDLSDQGRLHPALHAHTGRFGQQVVSVAAYDCESMAPAARLAAELGLPYPSRQAVRNCRDKHLSKTLWEAEGLCCPTSRLVRSPADAARFAGELGRPCVLKPLRGSGSELIFRCENAQACAAAFETIASGLRERRSHRLYGAACPPDAPEILAEEWIAGEEFSCDFRVEDGRATLIRLTPKILSETGPFGTARGYLLATAPPAAVGPDSLAQTLYRSAAALGLERAVCMLDFKIQDGRIVLLELAPRPGGDCLPFLLRRCWGLDILGGFLDFCAGRPMDFTPPAGARPCVGLRLHATRGGTIKRLDARLLAQDPRVREIHLARTPGEGVRMPPADYDSWLLGHVIFEPDPEPDPAVQCRRLAAKLVVEMVSP